MTVITTRIIVTTDGAVTADRPLMAGEYKARIEALEQPIAYSPLSAALDDLPVRDLGPWPEGLKLGREELYGDSAR